MARDEVRFYLTSRIGAKLTSMVFQYAELLTPTVNKLDAFRRLSGPNLLPLLGLVGFALEGELAEPVEQRRLAAILVADMFGYSRLMEADERGTIARQKVHRAELIDPKITEHHGRIVKTMGDGMLVEFASVVDAVECAVAIQQAMLEREAEVPNERRIQYRVGINLGDIVVEGDDILGDGVNIAARLEAKADPGGICISQAVLDQVKRKLALDLEDLGYTALKNIEEPVRTYRIINAGQTEEPAAATSATATSSKTLPLLQKRPSIAIMPFRNLNGDAQNNYIANGIGLGIQTLLVQLSGLFLINEVANPRVGALPAGREKAAARGVVVLREIILSRHRKVLGRNARSSDCDQAVHFALWATLALASYLEAS